MTLFDSTEERSAITSTPSTPSELPLVLIVATIGLSNQIAANFRALDRSIDLAKTLSSSHPATKSATANNTFPELKRVASMNGSPVVRAVGSRSQARMGV